jgi:hypothetical protein
MNSEEGGAQPPSASPAPEEEAPEGDLYQVIHVDQDQLNQTLLTLHGKEPLSL